jgi:hypothetical protein
LYPNVRSFGKRPPGIHRPSEEKKGRTARSEVTQEGTEVSINSFREPTALEEERSSDTPPSRII